MQLKIFLFTIVLLISIYSYGCANHNNSLDPVSDTDTTKLPPTDSIGIPKGETNELHIPGHNMYGDLLNDDPIFNKKYPYGFPLPV